MIYMKLNEKNIVIEINHLNGKVDDLELVDITDLEIKPDVGFEYDFETGNFTKPELSQSIEAPPTIEDQILAENQYQTMLLELNTLGGM